MAPDNRPLTGLSSPDPLFRISTMAAKIVTDALMGEKNMPADSMPLRRIDHVRLFVGNARQSTYFYRNAFGFDVIAYAGLETRVRHEAGYVLRQGQITFVLVSPLSGQHPESQRLIQHGDGVMDIALEVDDVRRIFEEAV